MRVAIIGHEVKTRAEIRNYSGSWSFYLAREMRKLGVEVSFTPAWDDPVHFAALAKTGVDHVLALGTFLTRCRPAVVTTLKRTIPGAVAQVRDRGGGRVCRVADITFCVSGAKGAGAERIGWAADPEVFTPAQDDVLTILIDHPNYGDLATRVDLSAVVLREVAALAAQRPIRVLRLVDGGFEEIDPASAAVPTFSRVHIPLEAIAAAYGRAHVFMVTHPESVGQTVLETAMAGALTVSPLGFIAGELLASVRHAKFTEPMRWAETLAAVNPPASRAKAMGNSWDAVAKRIVASLSRVRR